MAQPDPGGKRDDDLGVPPGVRGLRLLTTALMVVLILGIVTVVVVMVLRLGNVRGAGSPGPVTAESLALPEGAEVTGLGRAAGQVLVLTRGADGAETLRVFDAATGAEVSATPVRRE